MKIGELIELTHSTPLAEIARDQLEVGERKAREALKACGAYSISGKRGWFYEGDPAILEHSIYDYCGGTSTNKPTARKAKANVSKQSNQRSKVGDGVKELQQSIKEVAPTILPNQEIKVTRKRSSFDLDTSLMKRLKIQSVLNDKPVYLLLEDAIRQYLEHLEKR